MAQEPVDGDEGFDLTRLDGGLLGEPKSAADHLDGIVNMPQFSIEFIAMTLEEVCPIYLSS